MTTPDAPGDDAATEAVAVMERFEPHLGRDRGLGPDVAFDADPGSAPDASAGSVAGGIGTLAANGTAAVSRGPALPVCSGRTR
ncbi:MAG: hypothetical protein ABSF84_02470 [Acidimicrobiales bacterium]|jgi:hypothetical protein